MVVWRQYLVQETQAAKMTYGKQNTKKYIIIHETDNEKSGADADAYARLQYIGHSREVSWHLTVDDKEAVQSFLFDYACVGAGSAKGNLQGIQVTICVNVDGDYRQAVSNTAEIVARIMNDENIPISNVVQHHDFSDKNCPKEMREDRISWSHFISMVSNASSGTVRKRKVLNETSNFHVVTGTYESRQVAENVHDVMKYRFGWSASIEQISSKWRIKTGTFTSRAEAKKAEKKIKAAELSTVTDVIAE
ncbi:N-acetylmuramoyl-L-alanine amidase family protein [Lysinibacillus sp. NPDC097231]|uniref:peptidoglycan recognition protein family protein n=1 Tax=Lysinibacillus sp. NPDC097231 TaxID=3364142 RepID=UPI0037F57173